MCGRDKRDEREGKTYRTGVASALMWASTLNWETMLTYFISGFPVDCIHAASTWIFLWFAAEPMLEKLDRVKVKYGLVE